jgi:hypothetical protein
MKRLLTFIEGIGSVGALFVAMATPCYFPLETRGGRRGEGQRDNEVG